MIEKGFKGTAEIEVDSFNTAKSMGSGSLEVFATPSMVALMEKAAVNAVAEFLSDGETTVGTLINIEHISATPVNMNVTAEAEVTEINGREIVFSVTAKDEAGIIGRGTHNRFIVNSKKFMKKTNAKSNA